MPELRSKLSCFKFVTSLKRGVISSAIVFVLTSNSFGQSQNLDETAIIEETQTPKISTPVDEEAPISLFPAEDDELFQEETAEDTQEAEANQVENDVLPGIVSEESLGSIDPATAGVLDDSSGGAWV